MKSWLFLFIICGLTIKVCFSEGVKKDNFHCMAFLYYHDASVKNHLYEQKRFLQNAILIKPEFLLSASIIEPAIVNNKLPDGFPHKTLLARIGANTVDESLQYNEDENEQEREIVQVIRPFHYHHHVWWKSDISVLKSVTPFNVKFMTFPILYGSTEGDCTTLAFVKNNATMERQLIKYDFRVLPNTQCGTDFYEATMICGEYSYESPPPDFCEGNSGAPLMCSDRLVGLQSFVNNECKSPYLFQLLAKWQKFITCSISQTCHEDDCSTTCSVTYKDAVENSKETQVLPETLNVIPADVTESLSDEADITRTSAQPIYTFKSTSYAPKIIITNGFSNTIDSEESTEKSKENEDGNGDSESMPITTKGLDVKEKDNGSEKRNNLSLDVSKLNDIEEYAQVKEVKKNYDVNKSKPDVKSIDALEEKSIEKDVKMDEKMDDESEEKSIEKSIKIEDADESAEADKSEESSGTSYASVTKGLTKISLQNQDETFHPTTAKVELIQTTSSVAPIPTPLSANKALQTGDKTGTDIHMSHEAISEEKSGDALGKRHFSAIGDLSREVGAKSPEVNSHEASREVSAERHFDGSGASVISVETAANDDNVGSEENSGEKIETTHKSDDRVDLTTESTGDKSDEKLERRDKSESVEDGETRRRVVSGKLFPPTVSDQVPISTTTNESTTATATATANATEQFRAKEDKPEIRAYSHGTKTSYETVLISSVFFLDICIVSIFKINY